MSRESRLSQLGRGAAGAAPVLPQPGLRLRPGERPLWLDLGLSAKTAREWRRRAADVGLSVDVWLAVLLEHQLVRRCVDAMSSALWQRVCVEAERASAQARLAPSDELRRWINLLDGDETAAGDALPSVVLPVRVVAQLPHDVRERMLLEAAASEDERDAILIDRTAAGHGQTMEAWAYVTALRAQRV